MNFGTVVTLLQFYLDKCTKLPVRDFQVNHVSHGWSHPRQQNTPAFSRNPSHFVVITVLWSPIILPRALAPACASGLPPRALAPACASGGGGAPVCRQCAGGPLLRALVASSRAVTAITWDRLCPRAEQRRSPPGAAGLSCFTFLHFILYAYVSVHTGVYVWVYTLWFSIKGIQSMYSFITCTTRVYTCYSMVPLYTCMSRYNTLYSGTILQHILYPVDRRMFS